jgi:hypothetical protein
LRGQGAGHDCHIGDQACFEHLAETGNAVGKLDPVDAILQIRMLVADMQAAGRYRILGNTWGLQKDLIQWRIIALRQGLDRLPIHIEAVHPEVGKDVFPRRVQCLCAFQHGFVASLGRLFCIDGCRSLGRSGSSVRRRGRSGSRALPGARLLRFG